MTRAKRCDTRALHILREQVRRELAEPPRKPPAIIDWLMCALGVGVISTFAVMMGKAFLNFIF
jgi:hypothetical protein